MNKITVFTPTYNRAYKLPKLYESLLIQTEKDFEWLIIDDGSTDETEELVKEWLNENKIIIRYYKQENGGKHRAINKGADLAKGELFFIVDSDDFLTDNALERIFFHYDNIKSNKDFCGVSGLRAFPNNMRIGGEVDFDILDCTLTERSHKYKIKGDMAEAYITSILKEYKFPDIKGETFCAESLVWNTIAKKYKLRYFYEKIYICEYLDEGLSSQPVLIRQKNPQYACLTYQNLISAEIPLLYKVKYAINYWRYSFCIDNSWGMLKKIKFIGWKYSIFFPLGLLVYLKDKIVLK